MPNEWSLRHELLLISKRWPWLVLFCLTGAFAGWFVSQVLPSPYRATRELYVGLNAYRAVNDLNVSEYAGIRLVNANDYKNWQMSSLNNIIFMDSVIDETLSALQQHDPYWNSVPRDEFAQTLHVYWRNAGKWRLVAENTDANRAVEAVAAWQQIVVDTVHHAVAQSQEALILELQLRSLSEEKTTASLRISEIAAFQDSLSDWRNKFISTSSQPTLDDADHWQIHQQAAMISNYLNMDGLQDFLPSKGSPIKEYLEWLDQASRLLDQELERQNFLYKNIENEESEASAQFTVASKESLGLSASLDVDVISSTRTLINVTRPVGLLMLCGSLLGLFTCLGIWISQISLRGRA